MALPQSFCVQLRAKLCGLILLLLSHAAIIDGASLGTLGELLKTAEEVPFPLEPINEGITDGEASRSPQHSVWINSGKFQGDIAGVNPKFAFSAQAYRNAVKDQSLKWIGGVIPYTIAPVFTPGEMKTIRGAMETYRQKTCVKFVPWTNERDYLYIYKDYGCYSLVGKVGGRQELSLGRGCVYHEIIVHEMMHSLGFWHEQSRSDRDQYIVVKWENIQPGMKSQFDKIDYAYSDFLGERYDYYSVMHYDSTAFSRNGRNTIEAVQPGMTQVIGSALDLSAGDLRRINNLYTCQNPGDLTTVTIPTTTTTRPYVTYWPTPITTTESPQPQPECFDKFLDCPFFYRYCYRQSFYFIMKQYCPRTCGHCFGTFNDSDKKPEGQQASMGSLLSGR